MSNYFTYITTNYKKTVLYNGITNDLERRMYEHNEDSKGDKKTFAGKYNCIYLIYWERHSKAVHAIEREKEIKGWKRAKKEKLIDSLNPEWNFLNDEV